MRHLLQLDIVDIQPFGDNLLNCLSLTCKISLPELLLNLTQLMLTLLNGALLKKAHTTFYSLDKRERVWNKISDILIFLSLPLKGFRSKWNASWNPLYPPALGLKNSNYSTTSSEGRSASACLEN